jgi:hypothetical protein
MADSVIRDTYYAGLYADIGSQITLDHVSVTNAGYETVSNNTPALFIAGMTTTLTLADSTMRSNRYGLYAQTGSNATIRSTVIQSNTIAGIYLVDAGTTISVTGSNISGNGSYGLDNRTGTQIDARSNWWGAASGPYEPVLNPSGTGDRINGLVLFDPWLTTLAPIAAAPIRARATYVSLTSNPLIQRRSIPIN